MFLFKSYNPRLHLKNNYMFITFEKMYLYYVISKLCNIEIKIMVLGWFYINFPKLSNLYRSYWQKISSGLK